MLAAGRQGGASRAAIQASEARQHTLNLSPVGASRSYLNPMR